MADPFDAIDDTNNAAIRQAAEALYKAVWKTRGEEELNYIPEGAADHGLAGKSPQDLAREGYASPHHYPNFGVSAPYVLDENERYQGSTEQWKQLRDEYDWIVEYFEDFMDPLPAYLMDPIRSTSDAAAQLYNSETGVDEAEAPRTAAQEAIQTWKGQGAYSFKLNVWNRLPNIAKRQAAFATAMSTSLLAAYEIYCRQRLDALNLARKAKTAVDATVVEATDNSAAELTVLAGIATIVGGTLAIPFTAGASVPATLAGVSTVVAGVATVGAGEASRQPDNQRADVELGDDTVSGVLLKMLDAGSQLKQDLETNEQKIAEAFDGYMETLTNKTKPPASDDEATFSPRQNLMFPKAKTLGPADDLPEPPR